MISQGKGAVCRLRVFYGGCNIGGKKVYTKGVFGSENSSALTGKKRGLVYTKKPCFQGKRRKKHVHQRASQGFVGDLFAEYWCIDFGRLVRAESLLMSLTADCHPDLRNAGRDWTYMRESRQGSKQ